MRLTKQLKQLVPLEVSETVSVVSVPRYSELSSVSFVDFITMKRFNEEVKFTQILAPVAYRDTIVCFNKDSTRKKFKSETHYEPRAKPRKFSDTLVLFPKKPQKGYVTILDYHIDECRRWFRTSMKFDAVTYTTRKIIMAGGDEKGSERDCNDNINRVSDGPGASQIFLPRWNREGLEESGSIATQYPVLNSTILLNGY